MVERNYSSTRVEIFLGARELINRDTFSKSDPFCMVYQTSGGSNTYSEIGRTEVLADNLNPNWVTVIKLDYHFEAKQLLRFNVCDYDESSPETLGEAFVSLGELVSQGTSYLKLTRGGTLIVRIEEVKTSRDSFLFQLRGLKLDDKDTFSKSDPYLIIYRNLGNNQWAQIYKTEVIDDTLDPIWKPFELTEQELCNCDRTKFIKIECYDYDTETESDLIGVVEVTFLALITKTSRFELKHPSKTTSAGSIEVIEVQLRKNLSFIDYLRCGVQISLSVAIDFTGSNLEFSNPNSLHALGIPGGNQYERAIWEVGGILEAYDADRMIPVFGFGGVPRGQDRANHCFPLTKDMNNPYARGTMGVLELYRATIAETALSGPTFFEAFLNQAIAVASNTQPHAVYHVLLVLTDGEIMDMQKTVNCIVRASHLPLSIIIVGVGNEKFESMQLLDCDKGVLMDSDGRRAARDIVQFVSFSKFGGNPTALAAEVLKEIPAQLTGFMKFIKYAPALPGEKPISELTVPKSDPHHAP